LLHRLLGGKGGGTTAAGLSPTGASVTVPPTGTIGARLAMMVVRAGAHVFSRVVNLAADGVGASPGCASA
jgi:hypothetical protein